MAKKKKIPKSKQDQEIELRVNLITHTCQTYLQGLLPKNILFRDLQSDLNRLHPLCFSEDLK